MPEREVTRDGKQVSGMNAKNGVVGVWSTTERRSYSVGGRRGHRRDKWVQVSRLGNPLINEVIIPLGKKDKFNRTSPANDAKNFGKFALNPEPARLLNALFGLGVQETNRTDIVQALLTGVPGLTQIGKNPAAADTLKLNLGVAPAANPNRFGVLAGDVAGFPNGRRLADDAVDIELRVIAGALLSPPKNIPLGDGVDQNDAPFRAAVPVRHPGVGRVQQHHQEDRAAARPRAAASDPLIRNAGPAEYSAGPAPGISDDPSAESQPPAAPRDRDACSRSHPRSSS